MESPLQGGKFGLSFSCGAKKAVSAIAIVHYERVRYIGVFLWEFDRHSVGSTKRCPLLQSARYRQVWLYKFTVRDEISFNDKRNDSKMFN